MADGSYGKADGLLMKSTELRLAEAAELLRWQRKVMENLRSGITVSAKEYSALRHDTETWLRQNSP